MKLLFISNEYPPDTGFGGIATYACHTAEGLAALGHVVHVICRSTGECNQTVLVNGVMVHRIVPGPYPLPLSHWLYLFRKLCYVAIPQSLVRMAWAKTVAVTCACLIEELGTFDIIEYPECGAEGFYIAKQGRRLAKASVARLHTPWETIHAYDKLKEPFPDFLLQSYLERAGVRNACAVSAPSRSIASLLSKKWGLRRPVEVYPNPLPVSDYSCTNGNDWLYVGRIERRKGVHILVKAYAAVCKHHSPPLLRLVGRPYGNLPCGRSYGDYITSLIDELGMRERIEWIDGVPAESVRLYYEKSSVAFFPSLWENFSYACLEAMACGCAVGASDCGGYPEMIEHNDKNGLLFKPAE
jgi:glycogen(starch) synthase